MTSRLKFASAALAIPMLSALMVSCTPLSPNNGSNSSASSASSATANHYILRYHINNAAAMGIDPSLQSGKTSEYEMDAEVVLLDAQGGSGQVVIESIKEALPSLKDPFNKTLIVLAQPENGTTVFTEALWQTDADVHSLYIVDEMKSSLVLMDSSVAFNSRAYAAGYKSPDEKHVAVIRSNATNTNLNEILIIDLENDAVVETFTAPANRAVRRSSDMPFVSDITWTNASTLRVGLYDTEVAYTEDIKPVEFVDVNVNSL